MSLPLVRSFTSLLKTHVTTCISAVASDQVAYLVVYFFSQAAPLTLAPLSGARDANSWDGKGSLLCRALFHSKNAVGKSVTLILLWSPAPLCLLPRCSFSNFALLANVLGFERSLPPRCFKRTGLKCSSDFECRLLSTVKVRCVVCILSRSRS